ncbi:MAG: 30S ribosome-binding factor RbfA [Gammaproteobacteria bacterium]|nr:30S ribosome-binding factor RbfA [Gammaproteobacteria bacterium]
MPKEFSRSKRVGDLIQRELAGLIQRQLHETAVGMVTISTTDVSPDLKNATIYVTCIGNTMGTDQVVAKLNEHIGEFRHVLSKSLTMRSIPRLHFEYDHTLERANRLTALIDSLHTEKSTSKHD